MRGFPRPSSHLPRPKASRLRAVDPLNPDLMYVRQVPLKRAVFLRPVPATRLVAGVGMGLYRVT